MAILNKRKWDTFKYDDNSNDVGAWGDELNVLQYRISNLESNQSED